MQGVRFLRNEHLKNLVLPIFNSRFQSLKTSLNFFKNASSSSKEESNAATEYEPEDKNIKVTVIGAAGRVGRTLSLLLKTCPLVDELCMFDVDKAVRGYRVDVSHIDTKCCVYDVYGLNNIEYALCSPDVVIIAAGSPASPTLFGQKLFQKNAPIVAGLAEACARFSPEACVLLITNPINSLLPVAGEVMQLVASRPPSKKLFGLTTLDVVRANTFVGEATRNDPQTVIVPVVGGTSQETIVPVISQMKPCSKIKQEEIEALTECVKQAESSLADCQNCGTRGSSSLSTAYAAFRFTSSLMAALKGEPDVIECAYVHSDILPELEYLASPLRLGMSGIEINYGYPTLNEYEVKLMESAAEYLVKDIEMGKAFVCEASKMRATNKVCGKNDEICTKVEEIKESPEICIPRRKTVETCKTIDLSLLCPPASTAEDILCSSAESGTCETVPLRSGEGRCEDRKINCKPFVHDFSSSTDAKKITSCGKPNTSSNLCKNLPSRSDERVTEESNSSSCNDKKERKTSKEKGKPKGNKKSDSKEKK